MCFGVLETKAIVVVGETMVVVELGCTITSSWEQCSGGVV